MQIGDGKRVRYYCHSGNRQPGRGFTPTSRFARVVLVLLQVRFSLEIRNGGFMKRSAPVLILVAIVALSGCGGVSQLPGQTSIIVMMTTVPPSSLPAGGTASVAATASNHSP